MVAERNQRRSDSYPRPSAANNPVEAVREKSDANRHQFLSTARDKRKTVSTGTGANRPQQQDGSCFRILTDAMDESDSAPSASVDTSAPNHLNDDQPVHSPHWSSC